MVSGINMMLCAGLGSRTHIFVGDTAKALKEAAQEHRAAEKLGTVLGNIFQRYVATHEWGNQFMDCNWAFLENKKREREHKI